MKKSNFLDASFHFMNISNNHVQELPTFLYYFTKARLKGKIRKFLVSKLSLAANYFKRLDDNTKRGFISLKILIK